MSGKFVEGWLYLPEIPRRFSRHRIRHSEHHLVKPEVSLCIPTWQAGAFIAKTLEHARAQTWPALRILISVDLCEDDTAEICHSIAAKDDRVQVFVQEQRQGWAGNVNFLLGKVETPLLAFFWHDDMIPPDYVEQLATAFADRPDAMSAYGNTQHFGTYNEFECGQPFEGSLMHRLFDVLTTTNMGGMARNMMRRELVDLGLHIPALNGADYYESCWPWILHMVAAGPVIHVPNAIYHRLNGVGSSVVDGWRRSKFEQGLAGLKQNARDCIEIIRQSVEMPADLDIAIYCLQLFLLYRTRMFETDCQHLSLTGPGEISPEFKPMPSKHMWQRLDSGRLLRVQKLQAELYYLEGRRNVDRDNWQRALGPFIAASFLDPDHPAAGGYVASGLRRLGQGRAAHDIYAAFKHRQEREENNE
jgi:hypothetical protein